MTAVPLLSTRSAVIWRGWGKVHETRVYAANGRTNIEGHILMTARIDVWSTDAQRFLSQSLGV